VSESEIRFYILGHVLATLHEHGSYGELKAVVLSGRVWDRGYDHHC
jgi:hypothetical protein